jgi:peroxiredoxin
MKKRHVLGLLLIAATIVVSSFKLSTTGYKVGDKAMDFKLKNVDGKMVSLSDFKSAKGYIVVFTCNHCPFAKLYEDRIASKGYPVIAINPNDPTNQQDDSYDNMVTRAKDKNYAFPYLVDENQAVAKSYGATNTPHVFVLEKEKGDLTVKYIGAIDDNAQDATKATKHYVADAVNALLSGKSVPVTQTKAIGCGIKWKNS